jgi:CheY-like chemotaxis protein
MQTIPLISNDQDLCRLLATVFSDGACEPISLNRLGDFNEAIEFLTIEMPELIVIDFCAGTLDSFALLDKIKNDPWLHYGGIIGVCHDYEMVKKLEQVRDVNIIAVVQYEDVIRDMPRIMSIISENRRILFQHGIGTDFVENISASFSLRNNLLEARCYTNLVCNFLYNSHKIDTRGKNSLNLALTELLINAIEHGNCGIGYDEKTVFLENGGYIEDLIEEKCCIPDIAARTVAFEYSLNSRGARFLIADQGSGFDWRTCRAKKQVSPEELFELHGRGIRMSESVVKNLSYNEKGNEVSFEFPYTKEHENLTPGLFDHIEPREVAAGDVIFREDEPGNYLYYIVSGTYNVIVNGTAVSSLTPDDLFMGEMSFLLNNSRSATVQASTPGRLIEISKRAFVEALKRKPHYALFLSRLLAQRIQRLNEASAEKMNHR